VTTISVQEFREKARAWLEENATKRGERRVADGEQELIEAGRDLVAESKEFQARLYDGGFAGITWPAEYGGQGLTNEHQRAFNEEAADYELLTGTFTIGLGMCGPTILAHGSEAHKQRYIKPMLRADEVWCQLFSEPGAGSDVASLQSRAVLDGEEYVLNGQKVWTTGAHYCDYGIVIARTDPDQPKHRGISMFIVDMKAKGVTVKPLRQITGGSSFNEVFFDDVRIPAGNLVGEKNEGWRAAITMLMNERVAIGAGGGGGPRGAPPGFESWLKIARQRGLDQDPVIRNRLADVYIKRTVLGYIGMQIREAFKAGRDPGPIGSIAKLYGALLARQSADLGVDIAGPGAVAWAADTTRGDRWSMAVLQAPASAIAGGTNEIQRNIIGERVLGLPKEPQVDRDQPFKELKVGTQR
jgi:alkylation response protein AidB-like acyl-CoA dehydrogenase